MHAAWLASEFGIGRVVVPRFSSGFSALGCIVADMSYMQQHSVRLLSTEWDAGRFASLHDGMLAALQEPLHRQGHDAAAIAVERIALVRYVGQSTAVEVPFVLPIDIAALGSDFRKRHREIYGYATDEHWEMQSLRLRVSTPRRTAFDPVEPRTGKPQPTSVSSCWFSPAAPEATPRFDRDLLPVGAPIAGPAIIEDAWSTIVVPPGYTLHADAMGHLSIKNKDGVLGCP
jgi:N-methylhydantoinase A